MRTTLIITMIITCIVCVSVAGQAQRYWQDLILKPNQQWNVDYGTNPDDVLAFNVHQLLLLTNSQGLMIQELVTRLDLLEPNLPPDPNNN